MHISERTDFASAAPIVVSPRDARSDQRGRVRLLHAGDRGRALPPTHRAASAVQDCHGRSRSNALSGLKNERGAAGRNPSLRRIVGAQEPPHLAAHLWGWTMHTDLEEDFLVLLYDVARQMRTVTDQMGANTGRRGPSSSSWRGWSVNLACPRTSSPPLPKSLRSQSPAWSTAWKLWGLEGAHTKKSHPGRGWSPL